MNQEAKILIERGHQLRQEGKLDAAIQVYLQAIELEPDSYWSYQYLGEILTQQGDLERAAAYYRQALIIKPDFCWAYHCLGQIFTWQGQLAEAIAASRRAIEIEPEIVDFHEQLGKVLVLEGSIQQAISCYQKASDLKPDFWQYQFDLGNLWHKARDLERAIAAYRQAIELNPHNDLIYDNLVEIFSQQQNWEEAIATYQLLLTVQPESSKIRERLEYIIGLKEGANSRTNPTTVAVQNNSMQLFTDRQYLQDLYSSSPKLLIPASDRHYFAVLEPNPLLTFYEYYPDRALIVPLGVETTELVEVLWTPSFFLCLMTSNAENRELDSLIEWWQKKPTNPLPTQLTISAELKSEEFRAQFWQLMFDRMSKTNIDIAQRISTLQQQYLELRTLHEDTQNAFAAVEDFLNQAKLPPLQLTFEHLPEKDAPAILLQSETQAETITQLLPISSRGLAAIELHIAKTEINARGKLEIKLITPENRSRLAKWTIPYGQITPSWLPLDLPHIDISYPKEVELSISTQTELGPPPSLSAGKIQPIPEARVKVGEVIGDRSLALRLWQGLPGTRRPLSPYGIETVEDKLLVITEGYLGERTLSRVKEITPNLPTEDFPHIAWIEESGKILTHPREAGKTTVAMLPFSCPPQATKITATVATENDEASAIEYALVLLDEKVDPLTFSNGDFTKSVTNSGWIEIEPNLQHQIQLVLDRPTDRHYHIIIATRLPASGYWKCAWANWLNFFIEINKK